MNQYHFGHWYEWPENKPEEGIEYLLALRHENDGDPLWLLRHTIGAYNEYPVQELAATWCDEYGRPLDYDGAVVVAFMPLPRHPLKPYPPLTESFDELRKAVGEEELARLADIPPRPGPNEVTYQ